MSGRGGDRTKGCRRRALVELVDAYYLVIRARREVPVVRREPDGVDRAEVVAHVAELPRARVLAVVGLVDGLGRPYPDVAVAARRREALSIGGDVAAVDFEVLLFA